MKTEQLSPYEYPYGLILSGKVQREICRDIRQKLETAEDRDSAAYILDLYAESLIYLSEEIKSLRKEIENENHRD
ncbi:MAG: hypothetical protein DRI61_11515 [Chloroflexi bacterium]|nr:MAG: hypothetical protein DRI61_11515 [Chloroflexota bacterium]